MEKSKFHPFNPLLTVLKEHMMMVLMKQTAVVALADNKGTKAHILHLQVIGCVCTECSYPMDYVVFMVRFNFFFHFQELKVGMNESKNVMLNFD